MEDVYVGKNPDYKNPAIHYTAAECSKIEKSAILNVCVWVVSRLKSTFFEKISQSAGAFRAAPLKKHFKKRWF